MNRKEERLLSPLLRQKRYGVHPSPSVKSVKSKSSVVKKPANLLASWRSAGFQTCCIADFQIGRADFAR